MANDGTGNFSSIPDAAPALEPGRTHSAVWGDYDNDGWIDLFVPRTTDASSDNDHNDSLYRNNGDGTFTRIPAGSVGSDGISNVAAWADIDNDGFLDLLAAPFSSESSRLYRNNGNSNAWLMLRLVGTKSNRAAIGARIRVKATMGGRVVTQLREIGVGSGWFTQNDLRAHFGLGDAARVESVEIDWPSGMNQVLSDVDVRRILTVTEPDDRLRVAVSRGGGADGIPVAIHVSGMDAVTAVIESSADLQTWTELGRATPQNGDSRNLVFPSNSKEPHLFFRATRKP